ncbi:MAG TPA: isoprenylcysteine carboxylmethyltransferase family protein [Candidatus Micrarchaeia archaeon]|nr:isoprenylcysteine carboxylmethyltransferase family protein [Candidatus Micrarchaeia archaeon]
MASAGTVPVTPAPRRRRVGGCDAAVVAALAAQRALELRHSGRNLARPGAPGRAARAAPRSYPLMVATHLALFVVPLVRRWHRPRPPAPVRGSAACLLAAATLLRLWSIRSLGPAWNAEARVPPELVPVRRGPYRHCRHPNYVAVAAEFCALPLFLGAAPEAVLLSAADGAVLWARVRGEERRLLQIPAYREAFADVPRFLPRVLPHRLGLRSRRHRPPAPSVPEAPPSPGPVPGRPAPPAVR